MQLAKYILIRLALVFVFLLLGNLLYQATFWKKDISRHGDILENLWNVEPEAELLYLGESSNFHVPKGQKENHRISHILNELLPNQVVGTVDNSGLHAGTYLAVLKNLKEDSKVHTLIVTMNLRSFSADWRYSVGENYLNKTEVMLQPGLPLVNRFLVSLQAYDSHTDSERNQQVQDAWRSEKFAVPGLGFDNVAQWDSAMAWHTWIDSIPALNEESIPLACHYIKNFAFDIEKIPSERLLEFDEIVRFAKKRNMRVVFNLLAENMQEMELLLRNDLPYLVNKNRTFLKNRYEGMGALVVDNLYAVPDSCFVDRHWPTEHYSKFGKQLVAENLAKAILLNNVP